MKNVLPAELVKSMFKNQSLSRLQSLINQGVTWRPRTRRGHFASEKSESLVFDECPPAPSTSLDHFNYHSRSYLTPHTLTSPGCHSPTTSWPEWLTFKETGGKNTFSRTNTQATYLCLFIWKISISINSFYTLFCTLQHVDSLLGHPIIMQ